MKMPYALLEMIINHIKKKHPCPECGSRFHENNISIIATTPPTMEFKIYGLFLTACTGCLGIIPVTVEVGPAKNKKSAEVLIRFHPRSAVTAGETISADDILDMKNFLKNWNGTDVHELFKNI